MHGLSAIDNYITGLPKGTPEILQSTYDAMIAAQQKETAMLAQVKAASDAVRQTEWAFHNSVLATKESLRDHFGPDSGKRPRRTAP